MKIRFVKYCFILFSTLLLVSCAPVFNAKISSYSSVAEFKASDKFYIMPVSSVLGVANDIVLQHQDNIIKQAFYDAGYIVVNNAKNADYIVKFKYHIDAGTKYSYKKPLYVNERVSLSGSTKENEQYLGKNELKVRKDTHNELNKQIFVGYETHYYMLYERSLVLSILKANGNKQEIYRGVAVNVDKSNNLGEVYKCLINSILKEFPGESGKYRTIKLLQSEC
ncbi:DUF4136 domain-containing protein [Bartonella sp. DGB1]|uniref:DUF4136 domain-containing protein n=1 Tax=Bartonella sp. DGB1 TaxID=3239807 RepID=UPI00352581BA